MRVAPFKCKMRRWCCTLIVRKSAPGALVFTAPLIGFAIIYLIAYAPLRGFIIGCQRCCCYSNFNCSCYAVIFQLVVLFALVAIVIVVRLSLDLMFLWVRCRVHIRRLAHAHSHSHSHSSFHSSTLQLLALLYLHMFVCDCVLIVDFTMLVACFVYMFTPLKSGAWSVVISALLAGRMRIHLFALCAPQNAPPPISRSVWRLRVALCMSYLLHTHARAPTILVLCKCLLMCVNLFALCLFSWLQLLALLACAGAIHHAIGSLRTLWFCA